MYISNRKWLRQISAMLPTKDLACGAQKNQTKGYGYKMLYIYIYICIYVYVYIHILHRKWLR